MCAVILFLHSRHMYVCSCIGDYFTQNQTDSIPIHCCVHWHQKSSEQLVQREVDPYIEGSAISIVYTIRHVPVYPKISTLYVGTHVTIYIHYALSISAEFCNLRRPHYELPRKKISEPNICRHTFNEICIIRQLFQSKCKICL